MQLNKKDVLLQMNQILQQSGMLQVDLVDPADLVPQRKNARYFTPEKMAQLTSNVKSVGALESLPLVYINEKDKKYHIISGHHRVEAAKNARLPEIMVLVCQIDSKDEIVSKQLSHNALTGQDDQVLLAELFSSIEDISMKLATGLDDEIAKISYTSLNFRIGSWREFTILFLPEDEEQFDRVLADIGERFHPKPDNTTRITGISIYDRFADSIRMLKKRENIKSNATALMRLVELASIQLEKEAGNVVDK